MAHQPLRRAQAEAEPVAAGTDAVAATLEHLRDNDPEADSEVSVAEQAAEPQPEPEEQEPISATHFVLVNESVQMVGQVQLIRARADDTFSDIARTYGLGFDDLKNANPNVDPWLPGEGTRIVLPTQFVLPAGKREGVVLNIAAKRLYYFPPENEAGEKTLITHPIGIGRVGWATPIGESSVIAKAKDPVWYVPWSVRQEHREMGDPIPAVVPAGEDNPLGHRVLKLGMPGYLIHGTNQPYGVGMRVSHGCVRLYPENIESLYELVGLGTPVRIVNEPLLGAWQDGHYYVQMHPVLEDDELEYDARLANLRESAGELSIAPEIFEERVAALSIDAKGYPVAVMSRDTVSAAISLPIPVKNTVVVDNPVSEEELAELMVQTDQMSE